MTLPASRLVSTGALVLLLGYPIIHAQTGTRSSAQTVFRAETRLIHLTIVATTRNGQPVSDLKAEEIEVSENGRQQKVLSFEAAGPAAAAAQTNVAEQAAPGPPSTAPTFRAVAPPPGLPNRGYIVFVVDESATDRSNRLLALKAIGEWVDKYKAENDQVALVSLSAGVKVWQLFTADKRRLLTKIEEMKAPVGAGTDDDMVDRLLARLRDCRGGAPCMEASVRAFKNEGEILLRRRKGVILALIKMLEPFQGEKRVVYYGDGFMTNPGLLAVKAAEALTPVTAYDPALFLRYNNPDGLREVTSAALHANITFYTVDSRGLRTDPPMGLPDRIADRRGVYDPRNQNPNAAVAFSTELFNTTADSLKALGYDTGGRTFMNSNDLLAGARQAIGELAGTYYAVYTPDDNEFDGKFRKIEIKALRPGVLARTRAGYFAIAARQLAIKANARPPQPRGNRYQVPLAIELETSELSWSGEPGKRIDQVAVVMSLFNPRKELISTNALYLEVAEPKGEQTRLSLDMGAGPGSYTCTLTVSELRTTNFATTTLDITLPPLP